MCKIVYLVVALGEETAVQEVVGSLGVTQTQNAKKREMSIRGFAIIAYAPNFPFLFFHILRVDQELP